MDELLRDWEKYKKVCAANWEQEVARVKAINEEKLAKKIDGFEFPKRTEINTPSFESFMEWLRYEKGNK